MTKIKKFSEAYSKNEAMVYTRDNIENAINNLFDNLSIDYPTTKQREILFKAIKMICLTENDSVFIDDYDSSGDTKWSDYDKEKSKIKFKIHPVDANRVKNQIFTSTKPVEVTDKDLMNYISSDPELRKELVGGFVTKNDKPIVTKKKEKTVKDWEEIEKKYAQYMSQH